MLLWEHLFIGGPTLNFYLCLRWSGAAGADPSVRQRRREGQLGADREQEGLLAAGPPNRRRRPPERSP